MPVPPRKRKPGSSQPDTTLNAGVNRKREKTPFNGTGRLYEYRPLRGPKFIRLLCITGRPTKANPEGQPSSLDDWEFSIETRLRPGFEQFEAVSYVWGDSAQSRVLRLRGGQQLPITASISQALPYIAEKSTTGRLWIDQLCINQADLDERGSQVPTMGEVYTQAARTIAWTGPADKASMLMAKVHDIERISRLLPTKGTADVPWDDPQARSVILKTAKESFDLDAIDFAASDFCRRPWFSRGWIFQEAVLNRNLVILAGDSELDLGIILTTMQTFFESPDSTYFLFDGFKAINMWNERLARNFKVLASSTPKRPMDFSTLLTRCRILQFTNCRDRVYGFLGLLDELQVSMKVDYKQSPQQLSLSATIEIIKGTAKLNVLDAVHPMRFESIAGLPSWSPFWCGDLEVHDNSVSRGMEFKDFNASGGRLHYCRDVNSLSPGYRITGRQIAHIEHNLHHETGITLPYTRSNALDYLGLNPYCKQLETIWPASRSSKSSSQLKTRLLQAIFLQGIGADQHHFKLPLSERDLGQLVELYEQYLKGNSTKVYEEVFNTTYLFSYGRHLATTGVSSLASVPDRAKLGDIVVIAHGCNYPVILRPAEEDQYIFVGVCFLENTMFGEACT
ncbi:HET-domain-containing protein [Aulographum hederae CBS 113979]|uniref:HET-domain-containing protein n=1 Tax=Aulographum hederae CBS 113979 TaxID=1176131 RepID=A0A6G1HFJ5_9PEZI|nr:HET-domain-containing protein [Aulographum hederae CBS 113979]